MKNWKTTIAGIGLIAGGIALICKGQLAEGITSITGGIGLLSAADAKKTTV